MIDFEEANSQEQRAPASTGAAAPPPGLARREIVRQESSSRRRDRMKGQEQPRKRRPRPAQLRRSPALTGRNPVIIAYQLVRRLFWPSLVLSFCFGCRPAPRRCIGVRFGRRPKRTAPVRSLLKDWPLLVLSFCLVAFCSALDVFECVVAGAQNASHQFGVYLNRCSSVLLFGCLPAPRWMCSSAFWQAPKMHRTGSESN